MGAVQSTVFTEEEIELYEACTCLTAAELHDLHAKFEAIGGQRPRSLVDQAPLSRSGGRVSTYDEGNVEMSVAKVRAARARPWDWESRVATPF